MVKGYNKQSVDGAAGTESMEGGVSLLIEAGPEAFGSGDHPSTQGVVMALQGLKDLSVNQVLDMGCGSGILAIIAAQQWQCAVVAVDSNAEAINAARRNAEKNGVQNNVHALRSVGYSDPKITERGPYDLIIQNILAEVIVEMALGNVAHLTPGGVLILSGILMWQEEGVVDVYKQAGLEHLHTLAIKDWRTVLMRMPG